MICTPAQILAALPMTSVSSDMAWGESPLELCLDSRIADAESFFVCLKGDKFDAHDFIPQVIERGCRFCVIEQSWLEQNTAPACAYIAVQDTTEALGSLAHHYALGHAAKRIGITGSNGKTTTKEMLRAVLSTEMKGIWTQANNNNHIGVPLTLSTLFEEAQFAIIEMGTNHPGEIARLSKIGSPHFALITNIGDSHLEHFHNRDNVFVEKTSICEGMADNGVLVVNADDPYLGNHVPNKKLRVIRYGLNSGDIRAEHVEWDEEMCPSFTVLGRHYTLQTPGRHNLYNAVAVIAIALQMGISPDHIQSALAKFTGSANRTEMSEIKGIRVISDCYNANPTSMQSALETLAAMKCEGRRIAVLGDMFELGNSAKTAHADIGKIAAQANLDALHTVGEYAQVLRRHATLAQPELQAKHWNSLESLAEFLATDLQPSDLILFKASNGMKFTRLVTELLQRIEQRS